MAVEEINRAGDVLGRPLELVVRDSAVKTHVGIKTIPVRSPDEATARPLAMREARGYTGLRSSRRNGHESPGPRPRGPGGHRRAGDRQAAMITNLR
jgi:hypothetical protein